LKDQIFYEATDKIILKKESQKNISHYYLQVNYLIIGNLENELLLLYLDLLSSWGLLGYDAEYCCGRILTFQRSMLPPSSGWSGNEAMQRVPLKRWYPTRTVQGVTTQKTST